MYTHFAATNSKAGRFQSPPINHWSDYPNSHAMHSSPSILVSQPRKRAQKENQFKAKKGPTRVTTLGETYFSNFLVKSHCLHLYLIFIQSCSTPKKVSVTIHVSDAACKSPEPLPESPVLEFKESQPFDYSSWTKEQIDKANEIVNTDSS